MLLRTYKFIKDHLHLLEIDFEYGEIKGKKEHLSNGYKRINFGGKSMEVHKIIAVALYDKQVVNKEVNHINGIKTDNRAVNLEVITSKENKQHAHRLGLIDYYSKLTVEQVREIKEMILQGITLDEIALKFNVHSTTVFAIKNNQIWKDVQVETGYDHSKKVKKLSLSESDIENIFKLRNEGMAQHEIANLYNTSQTTIWRILTKKNRFKNEGDFTVRKKFTTTLDEKLIRDLKIKAAKENTDVSKIIEKTLKEMLRNDN